MGDEQLVNKPDNTALKQQRLPAWQPVLTAMNVLPTFIIVGAVFIPLGVVLLITSNGCFEIMTDYTDCIKTGSVTGETCYDYITSQMNTTLHPTCTCDVTFDIDQDVEGPLYFYYRLTNFYQNHRIYVKSRDNAQLHGETSTMSGSGSSPSSNCEPYRLDADGKPIAPCGTIANSLFNDTFALYLTGTPITNITKSSIAWTTDHTIKFKNPSKNPNDDTCAENDLSCIFADQAKPPYWKYSVDQLSTYTDTVTDASENGYKNQPFEVWMRTAAFPTFRKLYGKKSSGLSEGTYTLTVNYNYPTKGFEGTKSFVISQMTWAGGKNPFLGIAYIVVGSISLVAAVVLLIVHIRMDKKRKERRNSGN